MIKNHQYEIRSVEVQEILTNPPHSVIRWGNTIICLFLIGTFYMINTVPIPQREILQFKFTPVDSTISKHKFALLFSNKQYALLKEMQTINISFDNHPKHHLMSMKVDIDTMVVDQNKLYVYIRSSQFDNLLIKNISRNIIIGKAEIKISTTTFLDELMSQLPH